MSKSKMIVINIITCLASLICYGCFYDAGLSANIWFIALAVIALINACITMGNTSLYIGGDPSEYLSHKVTIVTGIISGILVVITIIYFVLK